MQRFFYYVLFSGALILLTACAKGEPTAAAQGRDFAVQARWIHEVLCAVSNEAPAALEAKDFAKQRSFMEAKRSRYKKDFVEKVSAFLKPLRPTGLPRVVVYPFGGSDLAAAMAAFPEAVEVTTVSLESAGDPRLLPLTNRGELLQGFKKVRKYLGTYFTEYDNSYENVWGMENDILPAQLTFSVGEAEVFGFRPVALRYFKILPGGGLYYYNDNEIASLEKTKGVNIHGGWFNPKCSHAFLHMEVRYVNRDGAPFLHRHISANLENSHYVGSPLEAHLIGKGKVVMMTKGASYLPWKSNFSAIRQYMIEAAAFMISDATGVLPWHAEQAGLEVTPFGTYRSGFFSTNDREGRSNDLALRAYWKSKPKRDMPIRFGYSEKYGSNHMLRYQPKR